MAEAISRLQVGIAPKAGKPPMTITPQSSRDDPGPVIVIDSLVTGDILRTQDGLDAYRWMNLI